MAGPFNRYVNRPGFLRNQIWQTQPRPYKTRLPYTLDQGVINEDFLDPKRSATTLQVVDQDDIDKALSRCYDRFKSKLGDSAQIGAGIAEWRSTASSISNNAVQLFQLAQALRSGNLKAAQRLVRNRKKSRKADLSGSMSNRWLEWSFGWKPLIEDIYNAISVLQSPWPSKTLRGRATYERLERTKGSVPTRETYVIRRRVSVQMLAEVRITNPNLYIANQLGLINPVSIAWELVPFSFVVDWFSNLGQVLGTMSDFAGMELVNPATTTLAITNTTYAWVEPNGSVYDYYAGERVQVNRVASITGPSLSIRPFNGFSVTRGANAIALLVQQLVR